MPADPTYESERRTRAELIDPKLAAAGWKILPFGERANPTQLHAHAVTEYPRGPEIT
jgi:type I site-specific restriction endonuclease